MSVAAIAGPAFAGLHSLRPPAITDTRQSCPPSCSEREGKQTRMPPTASIWAAILASSSVTVPPYTKLVQAGPAA